VVGVDFCTPVDKKEVVVVDSCFCFMLVIVGLYLATSAREARWRNSDRVLA